MHDPVLILDMLRLTYMDSAGVGLVMNAYISAQKSGRRFALAGLNDRVKAFLEVTRVDRVLQVFPSAEKAEAELLLQAPVGYTGGKRSRCSLV